MNIATDEDADLPPLVLIPNKKKAQSTLLNVPKEDRKDNTKMIDPETFAKQIIKSMTPTNKQTNQLKMRPTHDEITADKIKVLQKKFQEKTANIKKDKKRQDHTNIQTENSKSKFLINDMLNKISVKNISEELYPITNEMIQELINQVKEEIKQLQIEANKKQNSLLTHQNNQLLKKQLDTIKRQINHCVTIKELYEQKCNSRNKVTTLEKKISDLREQNRQLKLKVVKGNEKIHAHMHNLPCQNQRQLAEKLNKCMEQLAQEKQMRKNLEKNVNEIVLDFKRLYEEADTARMIVVSKLREIQEKQRKYSIAREYSEDDEEGREMGSPSMHISSLRKSGNMGLTEEKNRDKKTIQYAEKGQQNLTGRKIYDHLVRATQMKSKLKPQEPNISTPNSAGSKGIQKDDRKNNLQQQIKKMRNNQNMLNKFVKK